jgi:hypothetical protein
LTKSGERIEDLVGSLGPDEGFRAVVVDLEVALDGGFEVLSAAEGAAANLLVGQRGEPAASLTQPVVVD